MSIVLCVWKIISVMIAEYNRTLLSFFLCVFFAQSSWNLCM